MTSSIRSFPKSGLLSSVDDRATDACAGEPDCGSARDVHSAIDSPASRAVARVLLWLALSAAFASGARDTDAQRQAAPAAPRHDRVAAAADLSSDATYVLPGSAFGATTTLASLRRQFGAGNVVATEIDGAEGEVAQGIVLFGDDPTRRAELFMRDAQRMIGVDTVRVSGTASRWHLDSGVRPGMTLAALAKANAAPVSFYGLEWDYGGSVADWHGGKLAPRKEAPVFRSVSLRSIEGARDGSYPLGDATFRSDDRRYPSQGTVLVVGAISVSWRDAD